MLTDTREKELRSLLQNLPLDNEQRRTVMTDFSRMSDDAAKSHIGQVQAILSDLADATENMEELMKKGPRPL